MRVFINAGHYDDPITPHVEDPGALYDGFSEGALAMKIRDALDFLSIGDIYFVPDNLSLRQSIDWVNEVAKPDDLAIDIHLNSNNNTAVRGVEAYYADDATLAEHFTDKIAVATGIPNRGAKHDSESYVGKLGWLRQIKCKSVLIETCFITNTQDRAFIIVPSNQKKLAQAIADGIKELRTDDSTVLALEVVIKELWKHFSAMALLLVGLQANIKRYGQRQ